MKPRVAFVTIGGPRIGLGHVKRCLALARALAAEGAENTFVVSPDAEVSRIVAQAGFRVIESAWEQAPELAAAAARELGAEILIVDAYVATSEHFEMLKPLTGCLVVVDDTAERRLPVDVVVNVGAGTERLTYRVLPETTLLLGTRYTLLDPAFAEAPRHPSRAGVERVLVTLGGSVHAEALGAMLASVDAALAGALLDVVVGPFGTTSGVERHARSGRNRVAVHGHLPDLRPLMQEADLAVSGAGVTLYELAATATPMVMVQTEPFQAANVAAFERAGAALFAGLTTASDTAGRVRDTVETLSKDTARRIALGVAGRRLVDGDGARRVARELISMPVRGGR